MTGGDLVVGLVRQAEEDAPNALHLPRPVRAPLPEQGQVSGQALSAGLDVGGGLFQRPRQTIQGLCQRSSGSAFLRCLQILLGGGKRRRSNCAGGG